MSGDSTKLFREVIPNKGETLLSMITRSAEMNVHPRLHAFLKLAGIDVLKPDHIPFTKERQAEALGRWLGVDRRMIAEVMHSSVSLGYDDFVRWYGTHLPRGLLDAKFYRFSPTTLKAGAFQRAIWSVRPLLFCPYSKEFLIDECPACGRRQTWRYSSSMDICGKCRAPLTAAHTGQIGADIADDAVNAAFLASPILSERRRALSLLPDPFRKWESGEAFAAVVELGALSIGDAQARPCLARDIKAGDFSSYDTTDLVRGYRFLKSWPQSLTEELHAAAIKGVSSRTLQLTTLAGPFRKYFHKANKLTPLAALMREEVPRVLNTLNVAPLRSTGCCPDWVKRENTVTQNEAVKLFRVDASTLRRLHGSGRCVVMVRNEIGHIYDKHGLGSSLAVMREALSDFECAREIGAPLHCIGRLWEVGLLASIKDHDALIMAQGVLFNPASVRALELKLRAIPTVEGAGTLTIQTLLQARFHPSDWADAVAAALAGEIKFVRYHNSGPILAAGVIEESSAKRFLARLPLRDPPKDIYVSATVAGEILGISYVYISRAVALGLLNAQRGTDSLKIGLPELARFHHKYITAAEANRLFGFKKGELRRRMRRIGIAPAGELYGDVFWHRETVSQCTHRLTR